MQSLDIKNLELRSKFADELKALGLETKEGLAVTRKGLSESGQKGKCESGVNRRA